MCFLHSNTKIDTKFKFCVLKNSKKAGGSFPQPPDGSCGLKNSGRLKPEFFSKFESGSGYKKSIDRILFAISMRFLAISMDICTVLGHRQSLIPMPNCPPPFFKSQTFLKNFGLRKREFICFL